MIGFFFNIIVQIWNNVCDIKICLIIFKSSMRYIINTFNLN